MHKLIDILCGCGYRTRINPDTSRTKRCRNCGCVVFEGGLVVGTLEEPGMRVGCDWEMDSDSERKTR